MSQQERKVKLKVIKFLKTYPPYLKGETAGFQQRIAEQLVRLGVAEMTDITPVYRKDRTQPLQANGEVEMQVTGLQKAEEEETRSRRKVLADGKGA